MKPIDNLYLEMPITRRCQLHCDGCSAYANYGLKHQSNFEYDAEFLRLWAQRGVIPEIFRILGGEPTLHDDLLAYIRFARALWPESRCELVTNGISIDRHPDLPKVLMETNTTLFFSIHSDQPDYLERLRRPVALMKAWEARHGLKVGVSDQRVFSRFYHGLGEGMRPFTDNEPVKSWSNCVSWHCRNYGRGRLWKCPQIMHLRPTLEHFKIADRPEWAPYLAYEGLSLDCTDEQLQDYLTDKPEPICSMCPSQPQRYRKDVNNVDWSTNSDKVAETGEERDFFPFLYSVEPADLD